MYSLSGILILAPALWLALFPPTAVDALAYHLPAAKAYLQLHRVRPLLYLRFPVLPALGEMLFSGAMLLFDDVTAQLIEFLFLVLLLGALVAWSRRIRRPLVGLWSIGILAGTPSLMYFASTAYVDVGLTAFTTLAFYALHCYSETGDTTWLPLAGALGGCAASTKHSGLIVLILIFVGSVVVARSHRLGLRRLTPLA
ncbi:MAG TPA: glycosyltransferase family 39 protein, partial [Thermoanaerobaculia bacterium]